MSYGHVKPGDPINLQTLREELNVDTSYALVKTDRMEVIRMALPEGKTVEEHSVDSEISVLCLKGKIYFDIDHEAQTLTPDDWLYLNAGQPYSYSVKEETILLVTIVFDHH
jgi:quercetin dioxygenase-like cupin family protein